MKCLNCESENKDGAKFCKGCGSELNPQGGSGGADEEHKACPSCQNSCKTNAKFCPKCGHNFFAVHSESVLAPEPKHEAGNTGQEGEADFAQSQTESLQSAEVEIDRTVAPALQNTDAAEPGLIDEDSRHVEERAANVPQSSQAVNNPMKIPVVAIAAAVLLIAGLGVGYWYENHKTAITGTPADMQAVSSPPQSSAEAAQVAPPVAVVAAPAEVSPPGQENPAQPPHAKAAAVKHNRAPQQKKTEQLAEPAPASVQKDVVLDAQSESMLNFAQNMMNGNDFRGAKDLADQVLRKYPDSQRASGISNRCEAELKKREDELRKQLGM